MGKKELDDSKAEMLKDGDLASLQNPYFNGGKRTVVRLTPVHSPAVSPHGERRLKRALHKL